MEAQETSIGVLLDAFACHGQRTAITHAGGVWTYADLLERIHRAARALADQGLRRGGTIALLTRNDPRTFVLRYAANALGACVTVLNDGLAPAVVARMLEATGARVFVHAPAHYAGHARAVSDDLPAVTVLSLGPGATGADIAALADAAPAVPVEVAARPRDLASIQLSGGSTGVPKGIPRDFRVRPFLAPPAVDQWADTVQLLCTQLSRIGGMMADMVLAGGGRIVLHEQFDAGQVLRAVARERVTYISLLPSLLYRLTDHPDAAAADTSSLRTLAIGGRASAPDRLARAVRVFGPVIRQDYGASECGRVAVLGPQEHTRPELLDTVGRPLPGVTVTIRDPAGAVLPAGEVGEIWVRGPGLMDGYHRQPAETAKVLRDGWYLTGDLGALREDGYLRVVGRTKEVVHGARGKVYPAEVESALLEHDAVQDAVVFGAATERGDEQLCAAVVRRPAAALTEADVEQWVAKLRGARYVPEVVLFLDDVPLTGAHKPDVAALRRSVAAAGRQPAAARGAAPGTGGGTRDAV